MLTDFRDSEVQEYSKWDALRKLRIPRRGESKSSAGSSTGRRIASITRHAIGSVKMFFTPRTSVLEGDSVIEGNTRGRTSRESNGVSRGDSGEAKAPIQIDINSENHDRGSGPKHDSSTVVIIQNSENKPPVADASLVQEEKYARKWRAGRGQRQRLDVKMRN